MPHPPKGLALAAAALLCLGVASCTPPSPSPSPTPTPPQQQETPHTGEPSPQRPEVDLEFRVAQDLKSATGTERIVFIPDLEVCELVFRAWPNKPATATAGNALEVTSVSVDGDRVEPTITSAGAPQGAPGTLIEIPLPSCVPEGTQITAELEFDLRLGRGTDERIGTARAGDMAWLGTAYPLLAWENGRGWARDNAVPVTGETATSETFNLTSLRVVAPSEYAVLGVGEALEPREDPGNDLTTHEFRAPAMRDVTVTVGRIKVIDRQVGDTTLHIGGPEGRMARSHEEWADAVARAVTAVSDYLGPVPYDDIWVSVIPDQTEGIEYAGAIQFGQLAGEQDRWLISHEVAHLWFYGLVGNNQAQHPWMDESMVSFVQRVVDDPEGDPAPEYGYRERVADEVGRPMEGWTDFRRPSSAYVSAVYLAGADMLIEAREAAGREQFDAALRAYVANNAYRIATPQDVEAAFASTPEALDRMRQAGALG